MPTAPPRQGIVVTGAATALGLVLGVLYVWSVIKGGIPEAWGWSHADKALPYAVACLTFSLTMLPAGRLQDRSGPRGVAVLGSVLAGAGCIIAGLGGDSLLAFVLGFGVTTGVGIGFGYAAMTPAAVKWFPPERTGLVAGVVVAGSGLSPLWIAPLTQVLLDAFAAADAGGRAAVSSTMIALGASIIVLGSAIALLLRNPPHHQRGGAAAPTWAPWRAMLKTATFWRLFATFFVGAAAGLMFIGVAQDLGRAALGAAAFWAVVVLSIGNAGGRIIAGAISDRLGRQRTLGYAFVAQATVVTLLAVLPDTSLPLTLTILFLLGLNYGANLSIYPAAAKERFGTANFGLNYGTLFVAWGLAGLLAPWLWGLVHDLTGSTTPSTVAIVAALLLAALVTHFGARPGEVDPSTDPAQGT